MVVENIHVHYRLSYCTSRTLRRIINTDKVLKVWNLDLQILSGEAQKIQALAHTLNKAIEGGELDTEYITDVVDIMAGFAIRIVDKACELEVEQ